VPEPAYETAGVLAVRGTPNLDRAYATLADVH